MGSVIWAAWPLDYRAWLPTAGPALDSLKPMHSQQPITAIPQFVQAVLETVGWKPVFPLFRGEPANARTPLLPRVFRKKYDENNLLQTFRRRAHLLNLPVIPEIEATDQWLFLARHVGLPTRLLDWSEGALIGLYFALDAAESDKESGGRSVVWMLNPHQLNKMSAGNSLPNVFPLTWFDPLKEGPKMKVLEVGRMGQGDFIPEPNIGFENIAAAWEQERRGLEYPVAIEPTTIHPRMNAQHSYFTVHGTRHESLSAMVGEECLRKFDIHIPPERGIKELRTMGIADSTIMPDADSLAKELSRFMVE